MDGTDEYVTRATFHKRVWMLYFEIWLQSKWFDSDFIAAVYATNVILFCCTKIQVIRFILYGLNDFPT